MEGSGAIIKVSNSLCTTLAPWVMMPSDSGCEQSYLPGCLQESSLSP